MNARPLTPAARSMYRKLARTELDFSSHFRLLFAGKERRAKLADAFIETMEEGGGIEMFRAKAINAGISPALIFFLLGIVWDLLWRWWSNRHWEPEHD